ncbi:hypothetical protein AX774_g4653 [Zancudomyces culisetae]|uniref:Uncharacterized protein n=1 Tax=Zancudomyces culisetae TaxID=1213189 RepID=A0A1R1PLS0_ZANCU|nr:hypothetical protein AX774_g4653 [Zancudomyces culisetae]|eukprot:OMH81879.1 hypothetical protein AX774_g4653 [Zancudomyces culisetae]
MRSARETPKSKREAGNDVDERGSRYHTFTMDNREYKRFFSNDEITYIPEKHVERGDQVFRHSKATICEENDDEVKGVGGIIARGHSSAIVDKEQKYIPGTKATEQHWKKEQGEQGVKGDGSNGLFNSCRQVSETEEKNSSRGGRYEHTHSFSWNQATELGSKKRTSQYFEIDSQCNHPESLRYFSCDERNYSEGGVELKRHASEIDYDDDRNSGGSNSGRISDSSALGKDDGGNKIDHMQSGRETKGVNFLGMRLKNIDNNQAAEAREIIVHETKDMTLCNRSWSTKSDDNQGDVGQLLLHDVFDDIGGDMFYSLYNDQSEARKIGCDSKCWSANRDSSFVYGA